MLKFGGCEFEDDKTILCKIKEDEKVVDKIKWKLFDRKKKMWEGKEFFFEKWVQPESKSGIIFFSVWDQAKNKKKFIIEGYGIGTIDPKKFKEIAPVAPIQRFEAYDEKKAKKQFLDLVAMNTRMYKKI